MKRIVAGSLLCLFILSQGGTVTTRDQAEGSEPGDRTLVALDLMDLELPGEDDGDQMDLPPIEQSKPPVEEAGPSAPEPPPAQVESSRTQSAAPTGSVESPSPGIAPFLLEGAGEGAGRTRPAAKAAEGLDEEIPTELKTIPAPPSRAESLKLPSGEEASGSGVSDVPEIPLLTGEEAGGQETPVSGGQDSSLTLKPLSDLSGGSGTGRRQAPALAGRRQEDYLQVREDVDSRLIDIYERYYKGR